MWDLATTMSKLLSLGMPFEAVVTASTTAPRRAIKVPVENLLAPGTVAEFTLFDVEDSTLTVKDSQGATSQLSRLFEPRFAIMGNNPVTAHRHVPQTAAHGGVHTCPHCGWQS